MWRCSIKKEGKIMKQVYAAGNPSEAHFVKGLLEAENIVCDVQGELLWGRGGREGEG